MADSANLATSLYEAWNRRDFDTLASLAGPDTEIVLVGSGETLRGPEGARKYGTMWADAFPDGSITIDRVIPSGETVAVEFTGRGTHTGDLVTPMGVFPATGKSVTLQLCDVYEFRDGKVRSQHAYLDSGSLTAQLGLTGQAATTQLQAGEQ
ncbi:ester cyclase [Nostocoides sp. HKS02]|uniref:ester cyclase n=1 Tax=Nostocoides sp. HKS02 TaxID=1813880 RepID=UPI0012B4D654|nr:ester cyclase [Tetrasphaera sp. HKS02]QGN59225.1 DUF4440 domain-containing protein [Tetrasphaera sp. HKS02]